MEKERTKNKSPAPPRGDHKLHASPDLKPIRFYDSEPNSHCQAYLQKNPKFFPKNFQNFEKIPEIRYGELSSGILISNRGTLEAFLENVLRISEVRARVGDKDIYVEILFRDRSGEDKEDRKHKVIRRLIKVNRASDIIDYWLYRISKRPELLSWSFYIGPFLIVHDPEAPDFFEEEFYIYDEETGRSIKSKLRARYIVSCLVLDVDDVSREEIKARIEQAPVKPSYIVWSGKGAHLYFLFDQPHDETSRFTGFKSIANKLADIFGADGGAKYCKRYMRTLPYTYNSKYFPDKVIAKLEKMPCLTFYLPEEIDLLVRRYLNFDDEPQTPPSFSEIPNLEKPQKPKTHLSKGKDFWDGTPLEREWVKFLGMLRTDVELWKVYNGKDPRIRFEENGSIRCEILITMLKIRGFSDQFILELVKGWSYGLKYGKRADEMRKHPNWEISRLKSLIKHAKEEISEHPEFYILAKMKQGKGYSYKAICKLTNLNIAKVKHGVRVLLERERLKPKKVRKNGKWTMFFYKPMCPIYLQGRQANYTEEGKRGFYLGFESVLIRERDREDKERENGRTRVKNRGRPAKSVAVEKIDTHARLENKVKINLEVKGKSEFKIDTHEKRLATPLCLVNPEIVSELVKLEGRGPSEIKALYRELPKSNPLIAMFEKRVSELGVTGLEKDEAFALWVLQEKAKLNQKPKFHTGFT